MNLCLETMKMAVPPGNRTIRDVLQQHVEGCEVRGRLEGRSYPRSEQPNHDLSGLGAGSKICATWGSSYFLFFFAPIVG